MLCGGGEGVTEEAPGPRDRAAEGGSEGVKNCYGKRILRQISPQKQLAFI